MSKQIVREGYKRKAYTRSDGTKVKATYVPPAKITDRGAPGKGPKLIDMKDDRHLHTYGYSFGKSAADRHHALDKASKTQGSTFVIRRLNALRTLHKTTDPGIARKASEDMTYVRSHSGKK